MKLAHKIQLDTTFPQATYFCQACGTSRKVWNWALAEWNRLYAAGEKPNAFGLKKAFNAIKYDLYPWLKNIHRDAHAQPFANLGKAWKRFFKDIKQGKEAHCPKFKKKGKCIDSFYVANDKFKLASKRVKLPVIGWVNMREALRFKGNILGATVSRHADKWFISIQVDVPDKEAQRARTSHHITGVDLGLTPAIILSTPEQILAPKPLKASLRRLKIRARQLSRKINFAKKKKTSNDNVIKEKQLKRSANQQKSALKLARLHYRISNLRKDFTHKLTTRLCRENQALGIEDLNVKGMMANKRLARAIHDVSFREIRRQLEYKCQRYGTQLVIADRWYPSSKTCSTCHYVLDDLPLTIRQWQCPKCAILHDRNINAACNLQRLATLSALPVANQSAMVGT